MEALEIQIMRTLLPGMFLPEPLRLLFQWIEANDFIVDRPTGERIGFLFLEDELRAGWTETERPGGTTIEFFAEGNTNLKYWFGHERADVLNRLCVFANTGAEGSMAALWLDPDGTQRIVHLGSGSGSTMVCVLADDAVDFIRLLAIGYDEICWNSELARPPNSGGAERAFVVHPNTKFQDWVRTTFNVEIPRVGTDIVKHVSEIGDENSSDHFNQWVAANGT